MAGWTPFPNHPAAVIIHESMKIQLRLFVAIAVLPTCGFGQPSKTPAKSSPAVCALCIRKNMQGLASDAMRGRGSATVDEETAAKYVAGKLQAYGVQPADEDNGYLQRAAVVKRKIIAAPRLVLDASPTPVTLIYGKDFLAPYLSLDKFAGPLRKIDAGDKDAKIVPGQVVLVMGSDKTKARKAAFALSSSGAVAVLVPAKDEKPGHFAEAGKQFPKLSTRLASSEQNGLGQDFSVLEFSADALQKLAALPEGTELRFESPAEEVKGATWNAVGILRGKDPSLRHAAVLLSAHLDHLGIGKPVKGDNVYNGADDDASGTCAVLELARVLGSGPRPQRTVIFALFGSEELGGLGSTFFREHPPVPLKDIAANLEFEMIGRADNAVRADELWLTGWERSNLGPVLADHGAKLVGDPHPEENFFARSDNYVLAKKGVVAQTVSSYGLHHDYHQPSDDIAHIDFKHMDAAIGSLIKPVLWLVNSDFKPDWNSGGQP